MNTRSTRLSPIVAVLAACALAVLTPTLRADTPDAYLDYVESTGTQWIDTGVNGETGLKFVADLAWDTSHNGRADWMLVGARKETVSSDNTRIVPVYIERAVCFGHGKFVRTTTNAVLGVRHEIVADFTAPSASTLLYRNGTPINSYEGTYAPSTGNVNAERNLYVFACNWGGTANYFAKAKLYGLTIYRKNASTGEFETLRRFLPCLKDGRAALYDKEHGVIYFPNGGDLDAGPELPRPKDFVEWVQSDGANGDRQLYIDTGVPASAGIGMVADMEWTTKPAGYGTNNIFCGAASSDSKHIWLYDAVADSTGEHATHRMGYDTWKLQIQSNNVVWAGTRYRVETFLAKSVQSFAVSTNAPGGTWIPVANRANIDADVVSTEQPLYIFANNNAGTAAPVSAKARLYSLVLTNELGVLRDFIPCVADNGKAGLYDRVSERVFFPQAAAEGAAAEFDLDSEVGAATNRTVSTAWPTTGPEYIESDGADDYVDLDIVARDGLKMTAELEWVSDLTSYATFCGSAISGNALFILYRGDSQYHRMGYANGSRTLSGGNATPTTNERYRVTTILDNASQSLTVDKKSNGSWVPVGSGSRIEADAGPMDTGLPLYLFARNMMGTPDEFAQVRLYSLKLWQKNGQGDYVLVRDIKPAYHPDNDTPALFDRLNWVWYFNDGRHGGFTAGGATKPFVGRGTLLFVE